MQAIGVNDKPHRTRMLPQPCWPFSLSAKQASHFPSRTTQFRRSTTGRIHFSTLTASNELPGVSADSLCDDNLGLPTQMTKCED
jgi:hypothetical protein